MSWNRIQFSRCSAQGNRVRSYSRRGIKHPSHTSRNKCRKRAPSEHPLSKKIFIFDLKLCVKWLQNLATQGIELSKKNKKNLKKERTPRYRFWYQGILVSIVSLSTERFCIENSWCVSRQIGNFYSDAIIKVDTEG